MTKALPIAKPLATDKVVKKALKAVKKASKEKSIRLGTKSVTKAIRKGAKGFCLLSADVDPLDVVSHFPVFLEENKIPFAWIPSKEALGEAAVGRAMSAVAVFVSEPKNGKEEYKGDYDDALKSVKAIVHEDA